VRWRIRRLRRVGLDWRLCSIWRDGRTIPTVARLRRRRVGAKGRRSLLGPLRRRGRISLRRWLPLLWSSGCIWCIRRCPMRRVCSRLRKWSCHDRRWRWRRCARSRRLRRYVARRGGIPGYHGFATFLVLAGESCLLAEGTSTPKTVQLC
jgi:hypothetical protein